MQRKFPKYKLRRRQQEDDSSYLFTNLCLITARKIVEIGAKRARVNRVLVVRGALVRSAEKNVILQRRVLNPRLLRDVRDTSL